MDAPYGTYALEAKAAYAVGGAGRTLGASASVRTLPPPPTQDSWASDLDWTASQNGWGPVERDRSNGEASRRRRSAEDRRHRL